MGGWLLTANINPEGEAMVTLVFAMSINVLNELNRGPRAKGFKNQKGFAPVTLVVKGQNVPPSETVNEEKDELPTIPDREQYNKADSPKITVMWHNVKDIPDSLLKHISLENNENKPETSSRDTQEGLKMIKIFKDHSSKTFILDDFGFYEKRQKIIQEKA
ncbi:hypothetical protein P3X46_030340 [Hevea brasiliensis]|uniref:YTH domain-containing family protein n=1 Tax=Hevea brasiliensis TaxID=3981 RepID=A0ABQ9KIS8_HEVBR|nr:hypothetical protein P3X46_030340 [Hevea brasiliensis]